MNVASFCKFTHIVVLSVLLSGCMLLSSPDVAYYMIKPTANIEANATQERSELSIAMGPAGFPEYLERNQIVTRQNNRLHFNEFHRWGAPFERSVLSVLGENVSALMNTPKMVVYPELPRFPIHYRVVFEFLNFEGDLDNALNMNVRWMIIDGASRQTLHIEQTQLSKKMASNNYDDLVDAYNALLLSLSEKVAASVSKVHRESS